MSDYLPDDVVPKILTKLPVISLIRSTCVSKRWRSIISDPLFAKSYDEQMSANPRLLIGRDPEFLESLDLETVSSFKDMRKLPSPFKPTDKKVSLLGSCNGLICLTESLRGTSPFIWNPSTGMLQKLPHPEFSKVREDWMFQCIGFGYLSATDDYKVMLSMFSSSSGGLDVKVFSFRAQVWKSIQSQPASNFFGCRADGLLLNEALHWYNGEDGIDIMALDLATDQFRTMPLPEFLCYPDGPDDVIELSICVSRGSLYLFRWRVITEFVGHCYSARVDSDAVEMWIMSEYGVPESWTKLRTLRVSDVSKWVFNLTPILVMETSTVVAYVTKNGQLELVRVEHEQGKPAVIKRNKYHQDDMIVYEESLHWIHDFHGAGEIVKTQAKTQASGSKNE